MQEIAPHVYLETGYAGVALGAINWPHGLLLIDCPFRTEDIRSWRSGLLNLGGGIDRLMVFLDSHTDRTLGGRMMDSTIVAHEEVVDLFNSRSSTFKTNSADTGAEWEMYNSLGTIRWATPEISFSNSMEIHWDDSPMSLEYHPGPAAGAIWAVLPEQNVMFIGDAVMPSQPPFLDTANIGQWIDTLQTLLQPKFQNYLMVSSREGIIPLDAVHEQISHLAKIQRLIESLAAEGAPIEEVDSLVPKIINDYGIPTNREILYQQRLTFGLRTYYTRFFVPEPPSEEDIEIEA